MEKKLLSKKFLLNENFGIISNESPKIGSGHISRSLNLISHIKKNNRNFYFLTSSKINFRKSKNIKNIIISNNVPTNSNKLYLKYSVEIIKYNIKYLIIDSYNISLELEKKLRKLVKVLFVFDDYYWRKHNCDVLINNNFLNSYQKKLVRKLHPNTKIFAGEKYLLLDHFFLKYKSKTRLRKKIKKIFVFFGNAEPNSLTLKILKILNSFSYIKVNCIIGKYSRFRKDIVSMCKKLNFSYYYNIRNLQMLKLMIGSDLAIGSGGVNLLERLFLGLPSIVISTADNQLSAVKNLHKKKKILYLGHYKNIKINIVKNKLKNIFSNKIIIKKLSLVSYKMFNKKCFFNLSKEIEQILKIKR